MRGEASSLCSTMLDLLIQQAEEHGDRQAYVFLEDHGQTAQITFAELHERAQAIASCLQAHMSPGDRALLVYPPGLEFIASFFGCLYAGVIAVPATYPKPRRPLPRMNRIARDSGAEIALTTASTLSTLDAAQSDVPLDWIATDEIESFRSEGWQRPSVTADDLAFLQYTSGSTSDPKGVMVSHGNLLANLEAIHRSFGIGETEEHRATSTGVFWLPAYHDMGLIGGILTPLYVGGRSVLMSPTLFLQRPLRWLSAIDEYRASISGAPNFAFEYCVRRTTPAERSGLDLSSWRLAFCGAEPIRAETLEHFIETFRPAGFRPEALYPCYGLAESTLLAAGPNHAHPPHVLTVERAALAEHRVEVIAAAEAGHEVGHPAEQAGTNGEHEFRSGEQRQRLVACGHAVAGHDLLVVDPESGAPCGEGQVGEILLQGPSIALGYWNRREESQETFRARVPGWDGYFLRTGDLGFVHEGQLYVTGRLKDVMIIRGRNHYPQDLEQSAEESHSAVLAGAAFSIPVRDEERLVLVHQVDRQCRGEDWGEVVRAIRRAIVANHELDPYAIVLIRQTSLPVTSSGKVQRSLCRDQYLAGRLKLVHEWRSPVLERRRTRKHLEVRVHEDGVTWSQNGNGQAAARTSGQQSDQSGRVTAGDGNGHHEGPHGNGANGAVPHGGQADVHGDWNGYVNSNGNGHGKARGGGDEHSNGAPHGKQPGGANGPAVRHPLLNGVQFDRAVERIEAWLLEWLVERVGLDAADVEHGKPFAEYGVDSLTAVELSQELEDEFGVVLTPIVAWNYPTPAALARYLAEQSLGGPTKSGAAASQNGSSNGHPLTHVDVPGKAAEAASDTRQANGHTGGISGQGGPNGAELEALLSEIENLSDEEAARLLAAEEWPS